MGARFDRGTWDAAFRSFLAAPRTWDWLVPWARASRCLPIYCDWTHALGIQENGDIVSHPHEEWPGKASEADHVVTELRIVNLALHQGRERYAWLAAAFPPRPGDAQACSTCEGTGRLPPPMICYCGGAGWVPAGTG
jgi:hypothetical protein